MPGVLQALFSIDISEIATLVMQTLGFSEFPLVLTSLLYLSVLILLLLEFFDTDASHHMYFDKSILTHCFPTYNFFMHLYY